MTRARNGAVALCLGVLASACAHGQAPPRLRTGAASAPASEDSTARLIASAEARLAAGLAESRAGHLIAAREEFDRALEVYLTAPGGAYSSPRLAEAYRRTLETIQLHEFEALAAGDGFTETPAEPASIDVVADLPLAKSPLSDEDRRKAAEAIREEENDVPVALNDAVLASIELYQGQLRDWFAEALARGGRYLPRISDVFAAEGIPQDLAYVALVESAFKTGALSRARAKGVWQFIPSTARRFGLTQDWWVDERSNPEKSTRAAARYLKSLYEMFQDWNLALAAYNAGEGKILRAIRRKGTRDFWELARIRALPRETRNYVPMIHAAIVVAKAPEHYGFDVTPEPAFTFDSVPVVGAVDLRLIAECAGADIDQIRLLNPELRRLATPASRTFHVRVPAGAGGALSECLAATPPEKRVTFRTHVVRRGETLFAIAKRYGSRPQDIAQANGLRSAKRLAKGAELIIPINPRGPVAGGPPRPMAADAAVEGPDADLSSRPVRISYRVKAGDTLSAIASRYKTTVRHLKSWNKGLHGTRIAEGVTLTVYTRRAD